MIWINLKEQIPEFKKQVLVTDKMLNEDHEKMVSTVSSLNGVWKDECGEKLEWDDVYNSGIIKPTHFCEIPVIE